MSRSKITIVPFGFLVVMTVALAGCATSGPKEASKLVSHVEDSRRALQAAEAQLRSTFETANALGETERVKLQSDFQRFSSDVKLYHEKLAELRTRIAAMNKTGDSYFTAWAAELDKHETEEFRARSKARLKETRDRYNEVLTAMQEADAKFTPFLSRLHDLSLYLRYNLNPTGVASIKGDVAAISAEVTDLYTAVTTAVRQADGFVDAIAP
jgi:hypothetical protein